MTPIAAPITACPGCGVVSSENYDGRGSCWECFERNTPPNGSQHSDWPRNENRGDASAGDVGANVTKALAASRVDLLELIERGLPERAFVPGADGWLAQGKRHLIAAKRKTGKSLAVGVVAAVDVVRAGGTVVVLDRETGADEYARRLDSVLRGRRADDELRRLVRANYRYYAWPLFKLEWGSDPAGYAKAFDGASVVIFDSSRKFLTSVALKEDSSDDYSTFTEALVDPLAVAGIATVILDNTGHEQERSRGSSAKEDLADVIYALNTGTGFGLERAGRLDLSVRASRLPEVDGTWILELGAGSYGSWRRRDGSDARKAFHAACVAALTDSGKLGRDKLIKAARDRGATGTDERLREWLGEFLIDDVSPITHDGGYVLAEGVGGSQRPGPPTPRAADLGGGASLRGPRPGMGEDAAQGVRSAWTDDELQALIDAEGSA